MDLPECLVRRSVPWPMLLRTLGLAVLALAGCTSERSAAPAVTAVTRDAHTRFPVDEGAHAGTDCNACHGDFDTFASFTCLSGGCHAQAATDSAHVRVEGYGYDSARCLACHQGGTAEVDHARFFPIAAGDVHARLDCGQCHTDPADRRQLTCGGCHAHPASAMPAAHAAVAEFAPVAGQCLRCHADGQVPRVADHRPFPIGAGSAHRDAGCARCHPASRVDRPWASDFSSAAVSCLSAGCHAEPATRDQHGGIQGYAYASARCLSCHPSGKADFDHGAYFPIAAGSSHSGLACADCHARGSDRTAVTCDGCHAHPAQSAPQHHAAVAGFGESATECLRCHADSQVQPVSAHQPFAIDPSSRHAAAPCFACHAQRRADKPWAADFAAAKVACTGAGCHAEPDMRARHRDLADYAADGPSCIGCHPTGAVDYDHARFFPVANGDTHAGTGCAECHVDGQQRSAVVCGACHAHPAVDAPRTHAAVAGFAGLAGECLRCHADSQVSRVSTHTRFPIDPGAAHAPTPCFQCHAGMRSDKPWAADFTPAAVRCTSALCHPDPATSIGHRNVADYAYQSSRCLDCHPAGKAAVDHTPYFPIASGEQHQGLACASCHTNPADRRVLTCDGCHDHPATTAAATHAAVAGFAGVATECLRCHADAQVQRVATHGPLPLGAGSAHAQTPCFSCHPAQRADKGWAADFSRAAASCVSASCHADPATSARHRYVSGYSHQTERCLGCHPAGKAAVDHTPYFPIASGEQHQGLACASCHTNPADRRVLTCDGCHDHPATTAAATHAAVAGFAGVAIECLRCHADAQVQRVATHGPFNIGAGTFHEQSACFSCHPAMRADKTWATDFSAAAVGCTTGSCHPTAEMGPRHGSVAGYVYAAASCVACHPAGTVTMNHTGYFPVAAGEVHQNLACRTCHANASARTVVTCGACHDHTTADMRTRHTGVFDYLSVEAQCLRCHASADVQRVAAHLPFRIGSGTKHARTRCFECHPTMEAGRPWAADFSVGSVGCLSCHTRAATDANHRGRAGYSWTTASCLQAGCHANGR